MQTHPPDSRSVLGSTYPPVEASYLPDIATPHPSIIACDPIGTRHQLINHVVLECGARAHWVNGFSAIQQADPSCLSNLAVVGLGTCPAPGDPCLEAIQNLKRKGFKVIGYAGGAESWSVGTQCLVLLAGASCLLDSAALGFTHELRRSLAHLLQGEAQRRTDEESLRGKMQQLGIVGQSRAITAVFQTLLRVSPLSDLPILITGETGTGKELLAHAIHQLDPKRCDGPFVALNCAAISPGLAESELFGHRRGAFTGADHERRGLVRAAEGGVLLLDEIGELDDALQAKLLRVLQEHRVLGVGEEREVPISVRIVAATNRDLGEMVQQRRFRADLFHRLNVLAVHIPPLRERPTDLRPLIEHFVQKYQSLGPGCPLGLAPEFIEAVTQLRLPGNARQLENLVRWVLVNKSDDTPLNLWDLPVEIWEELSARGKVPSLERAPVNGEVAVELLFQETRDQDIRTSLTTLLDLNGGNLARALEHCERLLIEVALHKAHGNQSRVARLLGITPRSVYNKVRKYQLRP